MIEKKLLGEIRQGKREKYQGAKGWTGEHVWPEAPSSPERRGVWKGTMVEQGEGDGKGSTGAMAVEKKEGEGEFLPITTPTYRQMVIHRKERGG